MQRSLRVRLLISGALAVFAALAVAWAAMSVLFERHLQRQVEADLTARGREVIASLAPSPDGALAVQSPPSDPRFSTPAGGLYWQVSGENVLLRSRSLWDATLATPGASRADAWSNGQIDGPFEQRLVFVEREIRLDPQSAPLTILLGADYQAVQTAREAFARELALFLALLWAVLSAAAWIQVELGLRPLEHVRAALGALRNQASARLSERDYPTEAAPLANAINELAETRERDLELAKRRAADLAHSLKTPLAALGAQSRRAREAGATDAADGLDRAIAAATRAVECELARTRAAATRGASSNARAIITRVLQVIERTEAGARLHFDNDLNDAPLPVGEDVLMEITGPLLENATRYAVSRVRISGGGGVLAIEDDGPGLDPSQAEAVLERGKRLDESGHGLGLSIANDLAQATGADLTLDRSPELGGLRVKLRWPQASNT